jgi:hypothetical protein
MPELRVAIIDLSRKSETRKVAKIIAEFVAEIRSARAIDRRAMP